MNADLLKKAQAVLGKIGLGTGATATDVAAALKNGKTDPAEARVWFINHSQEILKKNGNIPILEKVKDAMAPRADQANLCWAINGWKNTY